MAQTVQLSITTLLRILGWNGAFLLLLIISFSWFFNHVFACPCNWNVAYGTLMFLFPSLSTFMLAFFTYFRQDNSSAPWKALREFYENKRACNFYDRATNWDYHADRCVRCKVRKRDWLIAKIAVSVVISLIYPLVWLSLDFLQASNYTCAHVGPSPDGILQYCDFADNIDLKQYSKEYALAANRSQLIGGLMFVVTLFFLSVFIILYGEIGNYLKKVDSALGPGGNPLQITISSQTNRSPGTEESSSHQGNREVSSDTREPLLKVPDNSDNGKKAIRVQLSDQFAAALQGFFADGSWSEINVNCCQQDERLSSFGLRHSQARAHQRQQTQYYQSLHQVSGEC